VPLPDPKSKIVGLSKLKIGNNEACDTGDPLPHLEVERSKVKVTRPINADTDNALHLAKGRTTNFKHGRAMKYDDWHHRHARSRQRSKVKVTMTLIAVTENQPYIRNGNAYELQS